MYSRQAWRDKGQTFVVTGFAGGFWWQAMLKYEPQALKALITCTMGPNMAAN